MKGRPGNAIVSDKKTVRRYAHQEHSLFVRLLIDSANHKIAIAYC
jgi:hypothetical protein